MSYRMIAKLLNISPTAVLYWIKKTAASLSKPEINAQVTEVQIDEMSHFLFNKKEKSGFGGLWTVLQSEPLAGLSVVVLLRRSDRSTTS